MMKDEIERIEVRKGRLRRLVFSRLVCSLLASVGIFGGISSLIAGCISVVIHAIIPDDMVFDRAGTALLILGIPLLLLGSVFLDEIERYKR